MASVHSGGLVSDVEVEVGRYAVRTFHLHNDALQSLSAGYWWKGATCVARCLPHWSFGEPDHEAPHEACRCGIYGMLSLRSLWMSFIAARTSVAVIAAEGKTIIGDRGLRTAYARVVAYWCPSKPHVYKNECPDALAFDDPLEMCEVFRISTDCDHRNLTFLGFDRMRDLWLCPGCGRFSSLGGAGAVPLAADVIPGLMNGFSYLWPSQAAMIDAFNDFIEEGTRM